MLLAIVAAGWLAQAAVVDSWSPVPILSFGALFSLCTAAVGYGALRSKVNATASMYRRLEAKLDDIDRKVDELAIAIARIEGPVHQSHPKRGGGS